MLRRLLVILLLLTLPALAQAEPETVEGLVTRGTARFDAADFEGARADAERALQLAPDDFGAIVLMGRVLGRTDHWAEAMPYFDRALAQNPKDPVALRGKALTLAGLDRRSEGLAVLDAAIEMHPGDPVLYYNRAYVTYHGQTNLSDKEVKAALSDLRRAQELDPKDADAWGVSGWIKWIYLDDSAEALQDVTHALSLEENPLDYRTRALVYYDLGQPKRAEADLRRAMTLVGADKELRDELQRLLIEHKGEGESKDLNQD